MTVNVGAALPPSVVAEQGESGERARGSVTVGHPAFAFAPAIRLPQYKRAIGLVLQIGKRRVQRP